MKTRKTFTDVGARIINNTIANLTELEEECANDLVKEIKSRVHMPPEYRLFPKSWYKYKNDNNYSRYLDAWRIEKIMDENGVSTSVVNDYTVYWKKLGKNVPFGHFVEWGVGSAGEQDGNPEGYPYENMYTWDKATQHQRTFGLLTPYQKDRLPTTGQSYWGARAVPHIHPSVEAMQSKYTQLIKDKYK